MKKIIIIISLSVLIMFTSACAKKTTFEIAMITDSGSIDDQSFNQGTWEGIMKFADLNKISYKYYKSAEGSTNAYVESIDLAVINGAKIIVTPGFLFEESVYISQAKYPDISFILIDGTPHNSDNSDYLVGENTMSILFREQEAGFLAGYAAVAEGFNNLGFIGGMAVPSVVRFGVGYVSGIYYAAKILEKEITFVSEHYEYLGSFIPDDQHKNLALSWYAGGVDIIFCAAGGAGSSVMSAALDSNKFVIGVDIDQSISSETVYTSALKELDNAVYYALEKYYNNSFSGGQVLSMGVSNNGVGLPMETSLFENFTIIEYNELLGNIIAGYINVPSNYEEIVVFAENNNLNIENSPLNE